MSRAQYCTRRAQKRIDKNKKQKKYEIIFGKVDEIDGTNNRRVRVRVKSVVCARFFCPLTTAVFRFLYSPRPARDDTTPVSRKICTARRRKNNNTVEKILHQPKVVDSTISVGLRERHVRYYYIVCLYEGDKM